MADFYTFSGNVYDSSAAGTTTFALTSSAGNPIRYLQRSHIHVYLSSDDGDTWVEQARPAAWDFDAAATSIVLVAGITAGQWVRVLRITPIDARYVDFEDGTLLTAGQLDQGEDFSRFCDQEQRDELDIAVEGAVIFKGTIDLTADNAPAGPKTGWSFFNSGNGTVIQGGNPGWNGIVGDAVEGGERVIYDGTQWDLIETPTGQIGVIEVKVTDPITRDVTDPQRPDIGIDTNTSLRVASNKLEITPRTLWGQTYDGTGNVSGNISDVPILGNAGTLQITTSDEGKIQLFPDNSQGAPNLVECSGAFELWPSKRLALEADSGSKKVYFCPPATLANDTHYTWPNAQPASAGQVLAVSSVSNTGFSILEWVDASSATTTVVAPTAPSTSEAGQLWLNTTDNRLYAAETAASSNPTWRIVAPMPIGATPPASPSEGDQYWDTDTARAYVYIAGTTNAWVDQNPGGGGGGTTTGGSDDLVFQENEMVCTSSYTLTTGRSALSAGPITVNSGVTITIPSNQNWVIL